MGYIIAPGHQEETLVVIGLNDPGEGIAIVSRIRVVHDLAASVVITRVLLLSAHLETGEETLKEC